MDKTGIIEQYYVAVERGNYRLIDAPVSDVIYITHYIWEQTGQSIPWREVERILVEDGHLSPEDACHTRE